MKSESKETVADESKESPAMQKKEVMEGTEEHIVPEDFQRQVCDMIGKAHKPHLSYMRDVISKREMELAKKESKPTKFSVEDMPS